MMKMISVAVAATAMLTAPIAGIAAADSTGTDEAVVVTDSGPVRGTVAGDNRTFQGLPYAAPPTGELRWRSPRPPESWTETRDATRPADRCPQVPNIGPGSETEDCLYLNVTTPRTQNRSRPVIVWLHGGGNVFGSASDFDAKRLAVGGDVVVVTANYRLGALGFLGHPSLPDSGAFGLEDQQAALRWVRRNASAFGGNPRNVTLAGQSGGAYDVCAQVTSPTARGLFHRAILQSGSCSINWPRNGVNPGISAGSPWQPLSEAESEGQDLATRLGCADIDCLRQIPVAELLAATNSPELPAVAFGNRVLPHRPDKALATGRFTRMPVLSGTTRDEQRLATAFLPAAFTEAGYQQLLVDAFGDDAARVAARYPSSAHGSSALAWAAVATDRTWACTQLTDHRLFSRSVPTYAYEFAERNAPTRFPFPPDLPAGAYHSAETLYTFDQGGFIPDFTAEQRQLADQMIGYWTRFAATGDPNGDNSPAWQRFRADSVQSLAPGAIQQTNLSRDHNCRFWATV